MTGKGEGSGEKVTRKGFVDWLLGTSAGAFIIAMAYPVTRYIVPPEAEESSVSSVVLPFEVDDLAPNSGRINGELRAFSAICTHLDCTVQYRDDISHIWCACHNGHFDLAGRNIQGPPPEPLQGFDVNVRGSQIVVSMRT
jgi:Rieske Fe-S protein